MPRPWFEQGWGILAFAPAIARRDRSGDAHQVILKRFLIEREGRVRIIAPSRYLIASRDD